MVLGRQIGFTLTLAGIAGFIVSLGVAADSFVIYFERLKDEIREGRSPRSAVPRAWVRARRTIISANAISIMAAVVLYLVSVGTVQGFAFALGLATVLDLVVVFLFRHPIMTMFARTPAFLSPRVSGLGRVLHTRDDDAPGDRHDPREGGVTMSRERSRQPPLPRRGRPQHRRPAQAVVQRRRRSWCCSRSLSFARPRLQPGHRVQGGNEFQVPASVGTMDEAEDAVSRRRPSADGDAGRGGRRAAGRRRRRRTYELRTDRSSTPSRPTEVKAEIADRVRHPGRRDQRQPGQRGLGWPGHRAGAARSGDLPRAGRRSTWSLRFEWRMAVAAVAVAAARTWCSPPASTRWSASRSPRRRSIGFLTILGFALYDVVVVFDKVQENTRGITGSTHPDLRRGGQPGASTRP